MKVNDILKSLRQSRHLTQAEAATKLDVSLSSYQKYERDKNPVIPSLDVLIRLADFYHVTTDYLLGRDTEDADVIDQLAAQFDMTALERKILDNYLALPEHMRDNLMDFLHKTVQEVMSENN